MASFAEGWGAAANALGRATVGRIVVRTQVAPPIVIDPFAPAPPAAPPNPVLMFVRPEVTVTAPDGTPIATFAPYGAPTENHLPWLILGTLALALGGVAIVGYLARRL